MDGKDYIALGIIITVSIFLFLLIYPVGCNNYVHKYELDVPNLTFYRMSGGYPRTFTTIIIMEGNEQTGHVESSTFYVTIPPEYTDYAGNISYMIELLDRGYRFSVASIYYNANLPLLPNTSNFMLFSMYINSAFTYKNAPQYMDPTNVIIHRGGICENFAKLWAAIALEESSPVTIVFLKPYRPIPGHVFIVVSGLVIENNGKVYLNTLAAFENWYSQLGPYSIIYLTLYPMGTSFSLSKSSYLSRRLTLKYPVKYTLTVTRTLDGTVMTYTVSKNGFGFASIKTCHNKYYISNSLSTYYLIKKIGPFTFTPIEMDVPPVVFPFTTNKYNLVYLKENFGYTTIYYAYITNNLWALDYVTIGKSYRATFSTIMRGNYLIETQSGSLN